MAKLSSGIMLNSCILNICWTAYAVYPTNPAIAIHDTIKSNIVLFINIFTIPHMIIAIKPINRYVPNLDKSIFVTAPRNANMANINAANKNTNIIDDSSYVTNIVENVKPLTAE